jgi:hypothetical protein
VLNGGVQQPSDSLALGISHTRETGKTRLRRSCAPPALPRPEAHTIDRPRALPADRHRSGARAAADAARTPAGLSARLDTAYAALIDGLTAELADWIAAWGPTVEKSSRSAGRPGGQRHPRRTLRNRPVSRVQPPVPGDQHLNEWTAVLAARFETHRRLPSAWPASAISPPGGGAALLA